VIKYSFRSIACCVIASVGRPSYPNQTLICPSHSQCVMREVTDNKRSKAAIVDFSSVSFGSNTLIINLRCSMARAIVEVKQHWSVIGWVTLNLLPRAPPCYGRHVKSLVLAAFAVLSTHQPPWWVIGPFSLCGIHKEGQCPSSGDIDRLMKKKKSVYQSIDA
jgi:hypothetical protein